MANKRALITGITGQDGYYLSRLLYDKGYEIFAFVRRSSGTPFSRFDGDPELLRSIRILYGNLRDISTIRRAIDVSKPDEIYNLAALSDVGISFQCPEETMEVNYHGVGKLMTEAFQQNPQVRFYQASTSEMFGRTNPPQNEKSIFLPVSPYAEAKLRAHEDYIVSYREKYGAFACSGILFNHESPKRGENFVTRKITLSLAKIATGLQDTLELGNMDAKRDWGYAGDYVRAMWMMLQQAYPDDYVVSMGQNRTVRDLVTTAAQVLGMSLTWEGVGEKEVGKNENGKVIVRVNPSFYRPHEVHNLLGDSTKARTVLGWKPEVSFEELVRMMVESDLEYVKSFKKN